MKGTVIKSTGSWYEVKETEGQVYPCRLKGKFKIKGIKNTNPLAVGDHVDFEFDNATQAGIIINIETRRNYIIRKSTRLSKQTHIIASNLDLAIVVATIAEPRTSTGFIDRFLATAEAYSIPAAIVFNKSDIYNEEASGFLSGLIEIYTSLGYPCLVVSAVDGQGIDTLQELLSGKTTLFSGHSGVGKSTLINKMIPGLGLKTQNISSYHLKGVHTTTFAEMFQIDNNSFIIDTPGIKEFGLVEFDPAEISHFFPEMRALFNQCRFDNCTHIHEPGCAVRDALDNGAISPSRYISYIGMVMPEDYNAQ